MEISFCIHDYFIKISANGSADLRSPEKEVCFRSWDLANLLVVRSPRSGGTRSGCNPPNRCGERSGADFATTVCSLQKWRIKEAETFG